MFAAISRRLSRSSEPNPFALQRSLVVETVGGGIEKAKDFETILTPVIESVDGYFSRQIAAIPGPLDLTRQSFGQDVATATIFPETDEIIRALGRSLDVKDSLPQLATQAGEHVHALLGMRRRPAANGNGENFADHTIRSLAPALSDTRDYLALAAFKRILNEFAEHVNKLRRKDHLLKVEWNIHNDVSAKLSASESEEYVSVHDLTPEKLLDGLIGWLSAPEKYLRLQNTEIMLPTDRADSATQHRLPLLHCSDRRQWLVCLVRFPVAEGLQALEKETHHHRHIFI
jgi:hypothetical protein